MSLGLRSGIMQKSEQSPKVGVAERQTLSHFGLSPSLSQANITRRFDN